MTSHHVLLGRVIPSSSDISVFKKQNRERINGIKLCKSKCHIRNCAAFPIKVKHNFPVFHMFLWLSG